MAEKTSRRGRPRKVTASTKKTTGGKRGRPRKATATAMASAPAKRGRKPKATATVMASAPAKRGRPRKATATATTTATVSAPTTKMSARKLTVGDCGGKLVRSRLVGGYKLKKRVRKPKMTGVRRVRRTAK